MRASDSLVMDDDMLAQGNLSRERHGWCCTFWSMHTVHKRTPPSKWQSSPHTMHRSYGCGTVCGKRGADCMGTRHMSVCT